MSVKYYDGENMVTIAPSGMNAITTEKNRAMIVEEKLNDNITNINNIIAREWKEDTSYSVGDIVLYVNILWKCVTATSSEIPGSGTCWEWEPTTFGDLLKAQMIYRTNTAIIIGKWIDDKPIYRKTFTGTTSSTADTITNVINVGEIDTVISLTGFVTKTLSTTSIVQVPINSYNVKDTDYNTTYFINTATGYLRGGTGSSLTSCPIIITVEYTLP